MYLFVFNWVPALQEAARPGTVLPLGYIFSAFMVSMMIGSLLYTSLVSLFARGEHESLDAPASDAPLTLHAKLSSLVCAVSAVAFAVSVESTDECVRFWDGLLGGEWIGTCSTRHLCSTCAVTRLQRTSCSSANASSARIVHCARLSAPGMSTPRGPTA